jgi:signal recognition particle receptor subunit alpha
MGFIVPLLVVYSNPSLNRKSPKENAKEGKKPRKWDLGGNSTDAVMLDYTKDKDSNKEQQLKTNFVADTEASANTHNYTD